MAPREEPKVIRPMSNLYGLFQLLTYFPTTPYTPRPRTPQHHQRVITTSYFTLFCKIQIKSIFFAVNGNEFASVRL